MRSLNFLLTYSYLKLGNRKKKNEKIRVLK